MRMWGFTDVCLWRMDREGEELGLLTCLVSLFLAFTSRLIIYPTLPNTNKHKQANNPNSPKFLLSMTGKADSLLLPYVHQCQLGTKMCRSPRGTSAYQWPLPCIFPLTIEKWRESWMASHQWWGVQPCPHSSRTNIGPLFSTNQKKARECSVSPCPEEKEPEYKMSHSN